MTARFFLTLSLLWTCLSLNAQRFSAVQVRADMNVLKSKLERLHPGLYRYTPKAEFDKIYKQRYDALPDSMSLGRAYCELYAITALAKDGHTSLGYTKKQIDPKEKQFPLDLIKLDGKIYVLLNLSADSSIQTGTQVLEVAGKPIESYLPEFEKMASYDNWNANDQRAVRYFGTRYNQYYGSADSILFKILPPNENSPKEVWLKGMNDKDEAAMLKKRYPSIFAKKEQNLSLKVLDSLHTAVLRISSFSSQKFLDISQKSFDRKLGRAFRTIQKKGNIKHLVIDVTGNGGGFIFNPARLLKYIAKEKFVIVDTLSFKKNTYWRNMTTFCPGILHAFGWMFFSGRDADGHMVMRSKRIQWKRPNKRVHFDGNIFWAMNSHSYSATCMTLYKAQDMGLGKFVGTAPGGAYWGSFAVNTYNKKLPNTGFRMNIPLMKLTHKIDYTKHQSINLQPDIPVYFTLKDLVNQNFQPIQRHILNIIGQEEE